MIARNSNLHLERPTPSGKASRFALFLVFALLLHLPVFAIPSSWLFSKRTISKKRHIIYISRVRRKPARHTPRHPRKPRLTQLRLRKPKPKRRKPPKKRPDPKKVKGQVVDVAPTPDDRPPTKTNLLSEHNTRVKKQTISRHRRLKYKVAAPRLLRKRVNKRRQKRRKRTLIASRLFAPRSRFKRLLLRQPRPRPVKRPKPIKRRPRKRAKRRKKLKSPRKQRRLALRKRARYRRKHKFQTGREYHKRFSLNTGPPLKLDPSIKPMLPRGSTRQVPRRRIDLRPDFGTLSRIVGAPAPDHVKGIKEGDATYLNTRRYIYASFFNRIKQQVAQHWNPSSVYRRHDPYGNVYGVRDRATVVSVVLYKDGTLSNISIARSSGLIFLDQEAIRAFRAAHPFPNPPKALVDKDGKIRFRFNFYLQVSNRPGFQLFR